MFAEENAREKLLLLLLFCQVLFVEPNPGICTNRVGITATMAAYFLGNECSQNRLICDVLGCPVHRHNGVIPDLLYIRHKVSSWHELQAELRPNSAK